MRCQSRSISTLFSTGSHLKCGVQIDFSRSTISLSLMESLPCLKRWKDQTRWVIQVSLHYSVLIFFPSSARAWSSTQLFQTTLGKSVEENLRKKRIQWLMSCSMKFSEPMQTGSISQLIGCSSSRKLQKFSVMNSRCLSPSQSTLTQWSWEISMRRSNPFTSNWLTTPIIKLVSKIWWCRRLLRSPTITSWVVL